MRCLWQVEIDDYCSRVLAKHWPEVKRYGDIRECGRHNLESVDVICGGFPCQPHSYAGKRKGKADDRNLWPEYLRLVQEIRPRWVVGENVPGLITTMLDEVLSDLEGEAYTCETLVIPAVAFDAPHRRDRVFIIASRNDAHPDDVRSHRTRVNEFREAKSANRQVSVARSVCEVLADRGSAEDGRTENVANAIGGRCGTQGQQRGVAGMERDRAHDAMQTEESSTDVSYPDLTRLAQREGQRSDICKEQQAAERSGSEARGEAMADAAQLFGNDSHTDGEQSAPRTIPESGNGAGEARSESDWWLPEPDVGRVVDGISTKLDRLKRRNRLCALGNAVVPAVAEFIGRQIVAVENL